MIKRTLLLVTLLTAGVILPAAVQAGLTIEIGDRPYYSHGAHYWNAGYEMTWVPGHWSGYRHHWIHGQYVRGYHRHHHHYDDYQNDRYNDHHDNH